MDFKGLKPLVSTFFLVLATMKCSFFKKMLVWEVKNGLIY